jgi:S1-C subfamily serine protease
MDEPRLTRRRLLGAAGTTLSAAIAGCSLNAPGEATAERSYEFPDEFEPPSQDGDQLVAEAEFTQVYRDLVESVAAIRVEATEEPDSGGTGWVFEDDYLVTNEHVVQNTENPYVWFTEIGWREASVVGRDVYSDLAVIEVRNKPDEATALSLVDDPHAVGTSVAAIGNPFNFTSSFTTGVISGRNRNIQIPQSDFSIADGVQTDAALNPGNSGGPLVTLDGNVEGVVNSGGGDNVGFAISAAMVENVVPALIEDGEYEHSYMGVGLRDVTPRIIEANELPISWGVYIAQVLSGGPSDGVLEGASRDQEIRGRDVAVGGDVVVRMDDWTIPNRERLSAFLALETDPGDTIEVEVVRDDAREIVDLTLGSRPDPQPLS